MLCRFNKYITYVMSIGPKNGWKLDAWAKLRYVLPNQIWSISHAMDLMLHLSSAGTHESKRSWNTALLCKWHHLKSRAWREAQRNKSRQCPWRRRIPISSHVKHWFIHTISLLYVWYYTTYRTTMLFEMAKNASLEWCIRQYSKVTKGNQCTAETICKRHRRVN